MTNPRTKEAKALAYEHRTGCMAEGDELRDCAELGCMMVQPGLPVVYAREARTNEASPRDRPDGCDCWGSSTCAVCDPEGRGVPTVGADDDWETKCRVAWSERDDARREVKALRENTQRTDSACSDLDLDVVNEVKDRIQAELDDDRADDRTRSVLCAARGVLRAVLVSQQRTEPAVAYVAGDKLELARDGLWPGFKAGTKGTVTRLEDGIVHFHIDGHGGDYATSVNNVRPAGARRERARITPGHSLVAFESPAICEPCGEVWDAASWVSCPRCQVTALREVAEVAEAALIYIDDAPYRRELSKALAAVPSSREGGQ